MKKIKRVLISVYHKDGLEPLIRLLNDQGIEIISTGGTFDYVMSLGIEAISVESITDYPSILGGRVKTLHPRIFGGILSRRDQVQDQREAELYAIPEIDAVIVDLYPFEKTLASGASEEEIIEKIDIGGISLIRAAAKNFKDVIIVPSVEYYSEFMELIKSGSGSIGYDDRRRFAAYAFHVSSHYDAAIYTYFNKKQGLKYFKSSILHHEVLRYGENPHQVGVFHGNIDEIFDQLHGKAISFNNLVDIDAALGLIQEFNEPAFVIIKHTNACGLAVRETVVQAYLDALAGDPVSAFGGILATNKIVDLEAANEINKLFFEILIAPGFEKNALEVLQSKKNRIILQAKPYKLPEKQFKSVLNGVIEQDKDLKRESSDDLKVMTSTSPGQQETEDLLFANIIVKHTKSNAIVIARNKQLLASGVGQTSRVDALRQAILKAKTFGFELKGAVMASDAFFPFADCVEIAHLEGIDTVIEPGGSVRDDDSVKYCEENGMRLVFTGFRHFKH